jgi:hypothetical protein
MEDEDDYDDDDDFDDDYLRSSSLGGDIDNSAKSYSIDFVVAK